MTDYTLITGATGYLGRAFALACLCRGENLFLTGRSREKLEELSAYLQTIDAQARIEIFPCDLTDGAARKALYAFAEKFTFSRVINVAGADIQKSFVRYDEDKLVFQLRVCLEAAISVCNFAIAHRSERLSIINISSISGVCPMPYFSVYSAAKGALTCFSLALAREMKGTGVSICAVLPGAIYTRSDVIDYIKKQGVWGRIAAKTPDYVAAKALYASDRGRKKVIVGGANKLTNALTKIVPLKLKLHFVAKRWSKTEKDAF